MTFHLPSSQGLLQAPILGQTILTQWLMFPLKIDKLVKWSFPLQLLKNSHPQTPSGPIFYSTTFPIFDSVRDTFLFLPGWTKVLLIVVGMKVGGGKTEKSWKGEQKLFLWIETQKRIILPPWELTIYFPLLPPWQGQVWINGFNLGRYWTKRGPQQTLYVPKPLLFPRGVLNKITLLELENVPPQPQIQFLDSPILNSTLHRTYIYSLSADTRSDSEPMELSGHWKNGNPWTWDMEWAEYLGTGQGDHKESKAKTTVQVQFPCQTLLWLKFQRQYQLHTSLWHCLCLGSWVSHPKLPNTLVSWEEET